MQRIFTFLLLLFLPVAALADGMFIPTIAYPAKVTIPDQRALICFSNGTERLVIDTRFTGSGTNFAWVVPLPNPPVIEAATTGLFPTLQHLFRPEIVHEVPQYWFGILIAMGLIYLFRLLAKYESIGCAVFIFFILLFLATLLLPALFAAKKRAMSSESSGQSVAVLDRKLVGIFETTTITSRDTKALQNWLSENGYAFPAGTEPVIAGYVKDGWVFVAAKVRRDRPDNETSTPHPLSFTFKTDKPVYPVRLTGVDNGPLSVELYVFSSARAKNAHFKLESCTQPKMVHPLLCQWTAGLPVATKLSATLSASDMRNEIWLEQSPFLFKHRNRLFSRQGALTTALNWGMELFAVGLVTACLLAFTSERYKTRLPRLVGVMVVAGVTLAGISYLCLPKIEVKLVKGSFYSDFRQAQFTLYFTLNDSVWQTVDEARTQLREVLSDTNDAPKHWDGSKSWGSWENFWAGGQIREEDSPGNYLLRETNHQLQLVTINANAEEEISGTWDLPHKP